MSLEVGIERLATVAGAWDGGDLFALCDAIIDAEHAADARSDDVALLAVTLGDPRR